MLLRHLRITPGSLRGVSRMTLPLKPLSLRSFSSVKKPEEKPGLLTRVGRKVREEAKHYWAGTRLLGHNLKQCTKLLGLVVRGHQLDRREKALLETTVADLFRLVPFMILVIIPVAEFFIPFLIRIFPNMLPSTFKTKDMANQQVEKELKMRLEVAKFLQRSSERLFTEELSSDVTEESLERFVERVLAGKYVSNAEIIKIGKVFREALSLSNIGINDLQALARFFGISPYGPKSYLQWQLERKLKKLQEDDAMIDREGVENLTMEELATANHARGMKLDGRSRHDLEQQLEEWMELSNSSKVPPYLLMLSRSFVLTQDESLVQAARDRIRAASTEVIDSHSLLDDSEVYEAKLKLTADDITDETELKTSFLVYDKDADGFIDQSDLKPLMSRLGYVLDEEQLRSIIERVDANKDGKIDFQEFFLAWADLVSKRVKGGEGAVEDLHDELRKAKEELVILDNLEGNAPRVYSANLLGDKIEDLIRDVEMGLTRAENADKDSWNPEKVLTDIETVAPSEETTPLSAAKRKD